MRSRVEKVELPREDVERILERLKEKTKTNFIRITTNKEKETTLTGSKIGGAPYWKNIENYPKTKEGEKLMLLAQINLSDLPENDYFPSKGLLQFFICPDDMYGMNFDYPDNQDTFRVVYQKDIDDSVEPLEDIPTTRTLDMYKDNTPIQGEAALEFSLESEYMAPSVYNFQDVFTEVAEEFGIKLPEHYSLFDILTDEDYDSMYNEAAGHKLLGYPYFTQYDPRDYGKHNEEFYDTLLFQIDTDYHKESKFNVMFGDCGVANFFINHKDLKKLDFTKIYYNWDCC